MPLLAPPRTRASVALFCTLLGLSGATVAHAQLGVGGLSGRVVVGVGTLQPGITASVHSPYCATRKTETVQTLANGVHITRKSETRECRDSQGRTLRETILGNGTSELAETPKLIFIFDPVERVNYTLDVTHRTAHRIALPALPPPPTPNANRPAAKPAPLKPDNALRPQVTTEPLGSQTIEGVLADGTRTTRTDPAGYQGSDAPLTTVEERWVSKELGLIVLMKRSDPRNGDTTDQLTDISQSEPDPALFRVPADYTILDNNSR